jgi:hypothetical protein
MPWRKVSRYLPQLPKQFEEMSEIEKLGWIATILSPLQLVVERLWAWARLATVVVVILLATTIVLTLQVQQRNHSLHSLQHSVTVTQTAAEQARMAANKASSDLAAALSQSRANAVSATVLQRALGQINCIAHNQQPNCP